MAGYRDGGAADLSLPSEGVGKKGGKYLKWRKAMWIELFRR